MSISQTGVRSKAAAIWESVGVLVIVLSIAANLAAYVPPLQDLNEWAYQGYLIQHLALGGAIPAALKHWPVPNAFSQLALAVVTTCLSPIGAAKSFTCIYLLVSGGVMWKLSRGPSDTVDGLRFLLLISLAVVHAPYWSGEFNYQIGLVVLTYYFGVYGKTRPPGLVIDIIYSILLFSCHALCLGIFLIHIGWRSLLRRRIVQGVVSALPALALVALYATSDPRTDYDPGDPLTVGPRLSGPIEHVAYRFYVLAKIGPYQNMVFDSQGDFDRFAPFYWLGILVNVLFAGVMVLFFATWVFRSLRRSPATPELLTALTCAALAVVNPAQTLGIGNAGERFIYPALIIAVLFFEDSSRLRQLAGALGAFLVIFIVYLLVVLPREASMGSIPDWSEMNRPEARYHILFWHRPFMYLGQIDAAQASAAAGTPPMAGLKYETSLLRHKP